VFFLRRSGANHSSRWSPCFRAMIEEPGTAACATDFLGRVLAAHYSAIPTSRIACATTWLFGVIQLW